MLLLTNFLYKLCRKFKKEKENFILNIPNWFIEISKNNEIKSMSYSLNSLLIKKHRFEDFLKFIEDNYNYLLNPIKELYDLSHRFSCKTIIYNETYWKIEYICENNHKQFFLSHFLIPKETTYVKILESIIDNYKEQIIILNENQEIVYKNNILPIINIDNNKKQLTDLLNTNYFIDNNDKYFINKISNSFGTTIFIRKEFIELIEFIKYSPIGILLLNNNNEIIYSNDFFCQYTNKSHYELEDILNKKDYNYFINYIKQIRMDINLNPYITNIIDENGPLLSITVNKLGNNQLIVYFIMDKFFSEIESNILHEQRLHSIGEIAASILHEFNNLLTICLIIFDNIEKRNMFSHTSQDFIELTNIKNNLLRSVELINNFQNICKKSDINHEVIDVNYIIRNLIFNSLSKVIGEYIEIKTELSINDLFIKINKTNFEQVLINLILNARDAIDNKGIILIKTETIDITSSFNIDSQYIMQGKYICLSITDNGSGIDPMNLEKIFNPFFTTKKTKGNGLGLSTVKNIVYRAKGWILIDSEINKGTKFKIYLPFIEKNITNVLIENNNIASLKLLIVEDDESILLFLTKNFINKGFTVFNSKNITKAIEIMNQHTINLLITDIYLITGNGIELAKILLDKNPMAKIIFTSGYKEDDTSDLKNSIFIAKPFSLTEINNKVSQILNIIID